MPKMKTHSGAKKRFRVRKSGQISRRKAARGHNLEKKTSKRKSDLRLTTTVHKSDEGRVRRMLGV